MNSTSNKVRDDELWQSIYAIVQNIYSTIDSLIENFPNEEWATASKLRLSANDSLFYVSIAVGNVASEANKYDLNNARKHLFALQAMYLFAAKQKFITPDPSVVVAIDEAVNAIDKRIEKSIEENKKRNDEELKPWLEKYKLWQQMQQ